MLLATLACYLWHLNEVLLKLAVKNISFDQKTKDFSDVNEVNVNRGDRGLCIQKKNTGARSRPAHNINLQFMRGEKVIKAGCFRPAGLQEKNGFR